MVLMWWVPRVAALASDEVEDHVVISHARHHVTPSGAFCCRRGEWIVVEVGTVSFQVFLGLLGSDPEQSQRLPTRRRRPRWRLHAAGDEQ